MKYDIGQNVRYIPGYRGYFAAMYEIPHREASSQETRHDW